MVSAGGLVTVMLAEVGSSPVPLAWSITGTPFAWMPVTVTTPVVCPAGIITGVATVANAGFETERSTAMPPAGAVCASVSVVCAVEPATTTTGFGLNDAAIATVRAPAPGA